MATKQEIAAQDKQLADAQNRQQQIQALPAQDAIMKAQAVQSKAGMGQPQQGQPQQGQPAPEQQGAPQQ